MTVVTKTPAYEDRRTYLDSEGNVVISSDSVSSAILQRLYSYRGTYAFDREYGSNLSEVLNSKNSQITHTQVENIVRQALTPMIESGDITANIKTIVEIDPRDGIQLFNVICETPNGRKLNLAFNSLIYN
tara:strand:+ start:808 stop:1197 length:390 start_codon:yes stop_codon:yes gene_type:complete